MFKKPFSLLFLTLILLLTCVALAGAEPSDTPTLPTTPYNYEAVILPFYFSAPVIAAMDNTPADNPITDEGATLGRVLFYEEKLSANDNVSCASCHQQANGFSDPLTLSLGTDGAETNRHSMSLANARFYENGHYFWDERAATLEEQVLMPIQDSVEMGLTLDEMVTKLEAAGYYDDLFDDAFGSTEITSERVSYALAQFIRSMVSYQSKYDDGISLGFSNFTEQEMLGQNLFNSPEGNCAICHGSAIQAATVPHNNGLDATTASTDDGVVLGRFKVPSLRNIALTAPYMHDGRFSSLIQVIEHYNSGVRPHPDLAPQLKATDGSPQQLNLTSDEIIALVAFMNTLTDQSFIEADRFSDPFDASVPTAVTYSYLPTIDTTQAGTAMLFSSIALSVVTGIALLRRK